MQTKKIQKGKKEITLKKIQSDMEKIAYSSGAGMQKVYLSIIDYMAGFFDVSGTPVFGWSFNNEQNKLFHKLMIDILFVFEDKMNDVEWYDLFGDFFMQYLGDKDNRGQCFTPAGLADLCSMMLLKDQLNEGNRNNCGLFGKRYIIDDPTCGSGRLLLASATYMMQKHREYVYAIGEDIDATCVKQTAINLAIHGYYGEVVCHNTIKDPDSIRFGYIINESLFINNRQGLPSLRYSDDPNDFVVLNFWNQKRNNVEKYPNRQ